MNKRNWNTYRTTGYTHDVANDPPSTGGVHLHSVRQTRAGNWQKAIRQTNGGHTAMGPVTKISAEEGEALFALAESKLKREFSGTFIR